jgi:hypothetical protein
MLLALWTPTPTRSLGIGRNPVQESAESGTKGSGVEPAGGCAAAAGRLGEDLAITVSESCVRYVDEREMKTAGTEGAPSISFGTSEGDEDLKNWTTS